MDRNPTLPRCSCLLLGLVCAPGLSLAQSTRPASLTLSKPVPLSQVHFQGDLAQRYSAATRNLLARTDNRYSVDTFAASAAGKPGALWWDWPGDQIGRWYSVLHVAEGYGAPDAARNRTAIADVILPLQTKDGNFGPPGVLNSDDARIPSGNAFALRGLMDAYADTHDPRFLEAARKLAHYFEAIAPKWETRSKGKLHEFYGHCLDGLVALYEQGGDRWALELAERLAAHAGRTAHTHHSLSMCRGLIDLAHVTGKEEYLAKVEDYLAWCREHQAVTGGLPENMPEYEQDEGCALADWIVVNLMMFAATGQDRYLDAAEHTLINHFAMNQFSTGGFGHRSFTPEIVGGKKWQGWDGQFGSENPGCCSLWGQWALGQVGGYIVTQLDDILCVNLYPSAEIVLPKPGIRLEISSDFPRMTKAQLRVKCEKPETISLALRRPPWAQDIKVTCDGAVIDAPSDKHRVFVGRARATSATIDVQFVAGLRVVPVPEEDTKAYAIFDGPLCLGLPGETADVNLAWALLVRDSMIPALNGQGRPQVNDPSSGRTLSNLEPISANWLKPDVKNPARMRVLFQMKKAE
jgi:rhamnogalacturonyl hydrolase YesR